MSDVDPRFDPVFQRGFDGPEPTRVAASGVLDAGGVGEHRGPGAEASPARNPWLTVLWITAAVFTVVAVVAQYIATEITFSPTAPTAAQEYVLPAVFGALAPTLFAAGLATAIAALVIHALRWQPRD